MLIILPQDTIQHKAVTVRAMDISEDAGRLKEWAKRIVFGTF